MDDEPTTVEAVLAAEKVVLHLERVAVAERLGPASRRLLEFTLDPEVYTNAMVARLETMVLSHHLISEHHDVVGHAEYEYPSTWFQHLKKRYEHTRYLGWWVRLRPVRYSIHRFETHTDVLFEGKAVYPQSQLAFDERLGRAYLWESMSTGGVAGPPRR